MRAVLVPATIAALTAFGLVAPATPASATSAALSYHCSEAVIDSIPDPFTAVVDTDAPATMQPGQSVPLNVTSVVTTGTDLADFLREVEITSVDGTAQAAGTVDSVPRVAQLTIPRTPIPPTMGTTLTVIGTGPVGNLTAGGLGSIIELGAGDFTMDMNAYDDEGFVGTLYLTCLLEPPAQNLHVDSVSVVAAPTTTALSVSNSPVQYGDQARVTADVAQTGSNAKPAGTVTFSVNGKSVQAVVNGGQARATLPPSRVMGAQAVTAVFTPTDPNVAGSQGTVALRVVKADSITSMSAVYRPAKGKIVARGKVKAAYGTAVGGSVKYVLKRLGVRVGTKTVKLNKFDVARAAFGGITAKGKYTVIARYRGSDTLRRSIDRFSFQV